MVGMSESKKYSLKKTCTPLNTVLSTGGGRGEASPPNTPASPPPPPIFVTSSTFYIVIEVGPTLVSRTPQLLHHMGRGTPSSPCILPYLRLNTDSFSPKFQILDRTLIIAHNFSLQYVMITKLAPNYSAKLVLHCHM